MVSDRRYGGTPPARLLKSLALIQEYQPIVVEYLMRHGFPYDLEFARGFGISRRRYYEEFLEYAIAYAQGDKTRLQNTSFVARMPRKGLNLISRRLFRFGTGAQNPFNTILIGSSAEFVGKTVFHRRLRRPRCSPSLKASLASSAAAPALTLGCAPRCRLVWAMGNGASGGGSGHRV